MLLIKILTTVTNNIVGRITNMFNWKKKLLSSLDINKQEKAINKNKV